MKNKHYQRSACLGASLLLALIVIIYLLTVLPVQQSMRNHELIADVRNNDTMAALTLLHQGVDPNALGAMYTFDNSPEPQPSLMNVLLHRPPPYTQFPVLMIAANRANIEVVKALLERGADVNAIMPAGSNAQGYTALIYAAIHQRPLLVKMLLDKGADVHVKSCDGHTALEAATAMNHREIVRLLKQAGASE